MFLCSIINVLVSKPLIFLHTLPKLQHKPRNKYFLLVTPANMYLFLVEFTMLIFSLENFAFFSRARRFKKERATTESVIYFLF